MIKIDKANATPLDLTIISSIQDCQTRNIKFNNITFDADTITDRVGTVFERRKRGKWIPSVDRWGDIMTGYKCSECGSFNTDKNNFCPTCGCQMMREPE